MAAPWRMFTMLRGTNASFTSTGKTSSACGVNALGPGSLAFPRAFWTSLVFMGSVGSATLAVASSSSSSSYDSSFATTPSSPIRCEASAPAAAAPSAEHQNSAAGRLRKWREKNWEQNNTAWHKQAVNGALGKYAHQLLVAPRDGTKAKEIYDAQGGHVVLFPLSGKTLDIVYAATRKEVASVVGVEGVRLAVKEFAREHPSLDLRETKTTPGGGLLGRFLPAIFKDEATATETWEGGRVTILRADWFDATLSDAKATAVFDRGALVAIHPSLRESYVSQLETAVVPGARVLIVGIERQGSASGVAMGPPFHTTVDDIAALFSSERWSAPILLETKGMDDGGPLPERFAKAGLTAVNEQIVLVERK
mmetsp:Transcript_14475/g.36250  ORF Transcript_14475/g.36250 Transcript_14475/m.36250 type:complete len:366 (-) Transcript_14475:162-1259(-)